MLNLNIRCEHIKTSEGNIFFNIDLGSDILDTTAGT